MKTTYDDSNVRAFYHRLTAELGEECYVLSQHGDPNGAHVDVLRYDDEQFALVVSQDGSIDVYGHIPHELTIEETVDSMQRFARMEGELE